MTFRIIGFTPSEQDDKVTAVHYSYDRSIRLWIVTAHNAAGTQVGDAEFPYGADYAKTVARRMAATHALPVTAAVRIDL